MRPKSKTYGELHLRRVLLRLPQEELAEEIGVTREAVALAEKGDRPGGRVARDLARLLMSLERDN